LLELTWRGSQPIVMEETGEQRTFLEDGDELTMTGYAQGNGFRVGFGSVTSIVEPAVKFP
jgi:fumarylacetoacetase